MSSDTATSSRALRSRDLWTDKKQTRTQTLRKNTRSSTASKDGRDSGSSTSQLPGENRGRFRSKLTDTLKLKLIAQHPRNSNHKKTPVKPSPKPVPKKTPNKPPVPVTTVVKADTTFSPVGVPGAINGMSVVNNHHMPKTHLLYVGNLPLDITKQQLEDHFRKTGGVKNIRIPKEKGTDKGRGYAYVEFKDRISHGIGLRLHQTKLACGRRINVEFTQIGGKKKDKLKRRIRALTKQNKPPEKT